MFDSISGIFSGFGIADLIDILIVSFIFYKLLGVIRTSRTAVLAKGIAIIVIVFLISQVCHFYVINWFIGKLLGVGLISLVVVFQPELRRALTFLGSGRLGFRQLSLSSEQAVNNVNAIIHATDYFAARKEGAIMIIERETALGDIAQTGTNVDAALSEELLENIFYKGSPLHDGAVILRGDRILAAGCVLPLTQNPNLSKDLGTRHRAGIGISEETDAVALIVSEETGIISMAMDGKLSRFLDLRTVEKNLLNIYLDNDDEPDPAARIAEFWRKLDFGKKKDH